MGKTIVGNSREKALCKSNKNAMHIPNKQTFVFVKIFTKVISSLENMSQFTKYDLKIILQDEVKE